MWVQRLRWPRADARSGEPQELCLLRHCARPVADGDVSGHRHLPLRQRQRYGKDQLTRSRWCRMLCEGYTFFSVVHGARPQVPRGDSFPPSSVLRQRSRPQQGRIRSAKSPPTRQGGAPLDDAHDDTLSMYLFIYANQGIVVSCLERTVHYVPSAAGGSERDSSPVRHIHDD